MTEWTSETLREMHDREIRAQRDLLTAEIRRLDEEMETQVARWQETFKSQERLIDILAEERTRAQEKFEGTVVARFVQVNEFRGSLDDLGKTMATRRELETALQGVKTETLTALNAAKVTTDELRDQLSELRSRVDTGAPAGQLLGAQQQRREITATAIAAITTGVILFSALLAAGIALAVHG